MAPDEQARLAAFTTSLVIFVLVVSAEIYIGYRGYKIACEFKSRRDANFFMVALLALLLWFLRDVWVWGLFGAALDLRNWLLAIGTYLLYRRAPKVERTNTVTDHQ